jgi:hypothetical protein
VVRQSRLPTDRDLLAEHERDTDETLEVAIARAFDRVGIDVMERKTPFHEIVDVDALRALHRGSQAAHIRTTFVIYGHTVTVTSDRVRVYDPSGVA